MVWGWACLATVTLGQNREPVVTVLADFEDESVAASIAEVRNVVAADCGTRRVAIPARGRHSLAIEIGATVLDAEVTCELLFRVPTRFDEARRVAAHFWIKQGKVDVSFILRDATDQLFETKAVTVTARPLWQLVSTSLSRQTLRPLGGASRLTEPFRVQALRTRLHQIGRQEIFVDDLHVEHRVLSARVVRGAFRFDRPTKVYQPGSVVEAGVDLENRSRANGYRIEVELTWLHPDGSPLLTQRDSANLPAGGPNFRSRQTVRFSRRIEQPGLYRLVARIRARRRDRLGGRAQTLEIETAIAVVSSNRQISRGRATFFGIGTNLMREPAADQRLEIELAREIGANLLALDTPWSMIEPNRDMYEFALLDRIVDAVTALDMAPMIVLTQPPDWVRADAGALAGRRAILLESLARHLGPKVTYYRLGRDLLGGLAAEQQGTLLRNLRRRVAAANPDAIVLGAPLVLQNGSGTGARRPPADRQGAHWSYETRDDVNAALATLDRFAGDASFQWSPRDWWLHRAGPRIGAGFLYDSEAVLRMYVRAAERGVAGVVWFDLRDDDNDPNNAEGLRGLVRRDFSPRAALTGYASTAGMLTGLRYAGPVLNTPEAFESALFIGSDRQVAVLLPRPNRVRPAFVAPFRVVPGELRARDFERRPHALVETIGPPLTPTLPRPLFLTLALENAQPEPQLALGVRPWLRVPQPVFCGADAKFAVELDAPVRIRRGFLQIVLPKNGTLTSSLGTKALSARRGETLRYEVQLSGTDVPFERQTVTLRLSANGRIMNIPLDVRPLGEIRMIGDSKLLAVGRFRIGSLVPDGEAPATASGTVFAAHNGNQLRIALSIEDDAFVAARESRGRPGGDELLFALAVENADQHVEVLLRGNGNAVAIVPAHGTCVDGLDRWTATVSESDGRRVFELTVPAEAVGLERFAGDRRILLAVRYLDDDGDGLSRSLLHWGRGLDGGRSTEGFRWLAVVDR